MLEKDCIPISIDHIQIHGVYIIWIYITCILSTAHLSVIYSLVLVYQKGNVPITTKAILPILPGFHQFPDSWHLGFGTVT